MKFIRSISWLFACLVAVFVFVGCVTPKRAAFNTFAASGAATYNAMQLASDAKNLGKITEAQWNEISVKYFAWRNKYNKALTEAAQDMSKLVPNAVSLAETEVITLINSFIKPKANP